MVNFKFDEFALTNPHTNTYIHIHTPYSSLTVSFQLNVCIKQLVWRAGSTPLMERIIRR